MVQIFNEHKLVSLRRTGILVKSSLELAKVFLLSIMMYHKLHIIAACDDFVCSYQCS